MLATTTDNLRQSNRIVMATPSLQRSFDTSLIDVNQSFSSTETNTSGSSAKENHAPGETPSQPLGVNSNVQLYEQWASTYDTDGNMLQAIDDIQAATSIPLLLHEAEDQNGTERPLRILDLGCGTGRTTLKLLKHQWKRSVVIEAWDASQHMLAVAQKKVNALTTDKENVKLSFRYLDICDAKEFPDETLASFDVVVSTLVLEHVPLRIYWSRIQSVLRPGGLGIMSNMHPDMGSNSVAGFKDADVRRLVGCSYVHGVQETAEEAKTANLEIEDLKEVAVEEHMLERREVGERARKWIGKKVWYGMKFKKPI